jgi:hypothetical protein
MDVIDIGPFVPCRCALARLDGIDTSVDIAGIFLAKPFARYGPVDVSAAIGKSVADLVYDARLSAFVTGPRGVIPDGAFRL